MVQLKYVAPKGMMSPEAKVKYLYDKSSECNEESSRLHELSEKFNDLSDRYWEAAHDIDEKIKAKARVEKEKTADVMVKMTKAEHKAWVKYTETVKEYKAKSTKKPAKKKAA